MSIDPLSNVGGIDSFATPPTPPAKSTKCKRIVILATAAIAAAVGITAAVIFFGVPAVGLSPALAITAMVAGGIGLVILGIATAVAYKNKKRTKTNTLINTNILEEFQKAEFEKTTKPAERIKFGSKAFVAPKEILRPPANPTMAEWNKVKAHFSKEFDTYNSKAGKTVGQLMEQVYFHGTFYASADQRYNHQIDVSRQAMGVIIRTLAEDDPKTASRRRSLAKEMADAFLSCQDDQIRIILRVSNMIIGGGLINNEIISWWHDYKMLKLSQLISKKHPGCENAKTSKEQFAHIQSAYLILLGEKFGLLGAKEAKYDTHKPTLSDWSGSIAKEFQDSLNLIEFAKEVAMDINNPGEEVRLEKDSLRSWLMTTFPLVVKEGKDYEEQFGFYSDNRDYTDLATITDAHTYQMTPCITLNEVMFMLQMPGLEIVS
jgi:hypothetical protein